MAARRRHYSRCTEKAYVQWTRRFVLFHGKRHPQTLGARHLEQFLTDLAVRCRVTPSTQNQALAALLFLYRHVLQMDAPWLNEVVRAKPRRRLPVVLTRDEVVRVLAELEHPVHRLVAHLLYGGGLRLLECLTLRVKDVDFARLAITVRHGKGGKDRLTVLPHAAVPALKRQLRKAHARHRDDLATGGGRVDLPGALSRKFPNAGIEWAWQYVFPAARTYTDTHTGEPRRHHYHETAVQRAFKSAVRAARVSRSRQAATHFAIMPSFGLCVVGPDRSWNPARIRWISGKRPSLSRHNQRPLRKARRRSSGL